MRKQTALVWSKPFHSPSIWNKWMLSRRRTIFISVWNAQRNFYLSNIFEQTSNEYIRVSYRHFRVPSIIGKKKNRNSFECIHVARVKHAAFLKKCAAFFFGQIEVYAPVGCASLKIKHLMNRLERDWTQSLPIVHVPKLFTFIIRNDCVKCLSIYLKIHAHHKTTTFNMVNGCKGISSISFKLRNDCQMIRNFYQTNCLKVFANKLRIQCGVGTTSNLCPHTDNVTWCTIYSRLSRRVCLNFILRVLFLGKQAQRGQMRRESHIYISS